MKSAGQLQDSKLLSGCDAAFSMENTLGQGGTVVNSSRMPMVSRKLLRAAFAVLYDD